MPAEGIRFRSLIGRPGDNTRWQFTNKPVDIDPAFPFPNTGIPGKIAATPSFPAGAFVPMGAGDSPSQFAGFLFRNKVDIDTSYPQTPFGNTAPPQNIYGRGDRMVRGHMAVVLQGPTPVVTQRTQAYLRIAGGPIGLEAGPDATTPANTIALPGVFFTGPADSSSVSEVEINL